jgi:adenine phosphoribosyltransferase
MTLKKLKKSLNDSSVIKKGNYSYMIHPLTDGIPYVEPDLLREIIEEMKSRIELFGPFDKILTIEAMGIPIASALSLNLNIPFVIVRKRTYDIIDEIEIEQKTGYSESKLFINGLKIGDRIIIVDDIISTGGTIKSILTALVKNNIIIEGIIVLFDKGDEVEKIKEEFKIKVETLVKIEIIDNLVKIKNVS